MNLIDKIITKGLENQFLNPILQWISNIRVEVLLIVVYIFALGISILTSHWTNNLIDNFFTWIDKL